ncbi:peptidylprolyl isomerase [Granulicella sp. WH15]|uniref:peptidylprolyl isomerase n=1 Tax=Granulicella sp. WH15 TaxID=2602070 RepID=UPI00136682AE|nr:peptidylprolyl isomerase [Granulicella sp. WH15]QHN03098.1 peptidylprolyl isomerase [Granulicella sp. WH15]
MIRILQQDSRIVKSIFAIIIGLAVVTMVITLVPGIFDNTGSTSDGSVYATVREPGLLGRLGISSLPVKQADVTRLAQMQLQQQKLPPFLLPYMESRAAQSLVQHAMLKQAGDKLGLQVSDADLRRELQTGPFAAYLFPGGKFIGSDAYMNFIQTNFQLTVPEFEEEVKQDMEFNRLQALVAGGVTVPDNAVREQYKVQGTKVKFDYAVVSADDLKSQIKPTDADLQTFFKNNAKRYATAIPETRKIAYIAFDANNLPGGKPQVSDADLQAYYTAHQKDYEVKDQAKVRHILIAVPQGADAKTDAAAKAKAEDILKQIKAGGDFAKLAQANSDDPGSKGTGGELGMLSPGQTVPEFDKAAFSLQPGQTSDLIKTKFGYHILQVEERTKAHTRSLAEVKAEIAPLVEQQKIGATEQGFATSLANDALKIGMERAAAARGLHVTTTDYVAKDGVIAGVADGAALLTGAFGAAKGAAPTSVSTGDGFAVFQVQDVKVAHAPSFDEYKTHLVADYQEQKLPELLQEKLGKLDDRAKVLNDLRKAAAELNVPVKTSELVGRDGQVPDVGAMSGPASVAFTMQKTMISGPVNLGRVGVVMTLLDKQEPSAEEIAKNFELTKDQMLGEQQKEVFEVFVGNLATQYEKAKAVRYLKKPATPGPLGM